jgi:serine O-acetyltransferase
MHSTVSRTDLLDRYEAYDQLGLLQLIKSDLRRFPRASEALLKLGFYAACFYRISHYLTLKGHPVGAGFFQLLSHLLTGAEISHRAVIGPYLAIVHPTGVHIGPGVKIGAHATICECASMVTNETVGEGVPAIGDHLWASAGCRIMGPIVLGDHVWVGPNSVVLKNVDSNMVALGIPARILPPDFRRCGVDGQ